MRLIDADNIIHALEAFADIEHGNHHFMYGIESAKEIVTESETIDAVPVVRCGECKNFKLYPDGEGTHYGQCLCWMVGGIDDDDYCSYGAKREEFG